MERYLFDIFDPSGSAPGAGVSMETVTVDYADTAVHGPSDSPIHSVNTTESVNFTYAIFNESVWIFGPTEDTIILPLLLTIIAILAFFGNLLVVVSVLGLRRMRTGSNIMLLNMAFCDLVFISVTIPTAIINHASPGGWVPAPTEAVCKFVHYTIFVSVYVAIYTLVVTCVFRFFNEYMAAKSNTLLSRGNALISCVLIWLAFTMSHLNFLLQRDAAIFQEPFICIHSNSVMDTTKMRTLWITFLSCAFLLPLMIVGTMSAWMLHKQHSSCKCRLRSSNSSSNNGRISNGSSARSTPQHHSQEYYQQRLRPQSPTHYSNGSHIHIFTDSPPSNGQCCPHRNDAASKIELRTKREITMLIMAVMVLRTVCWLPIQVFVMLDVFGMAEITELYRKAEMLGVCFAFVGASISPLVYNCCSHDFRVAFQEVFEAVGCKCGDDRPEDDYSDMNETIMSIISDSSNHINYQ